MYFNQVLGLGSKNGVMRGIKVGDTVRRGVRSERARKTYSLFDLPIHIDVQPFGLAHDDRQAENNGDDISRSRTASCQRRVPFGCSAPPPCWPTFAGVCDF